MTKYNCPNVAKKLFVLLILSLFFVTYFSTLSYAITSNTINFQGKIVRNDTGHEGLNVVAGTPACVVDGAGNDTCDFQVAYYTAVTGGTLLLTETFGGVSSGVEIGQYDGVFELSLGSGTVTTTSQCRDGTCNTPMEVLSEYNDVYVELKFAPSGDGVNYTETFNRMPLEASAYAIFSKYAEGAHDAFRLSTSLSSDSTSNPVTGMVYFNTTDTKFKGYDGSAWVNISGESLWTDGGTFTYLTSTSDDLILGGSTVADATFYFDVDAGSGSYLEIDNAANTDRLFTILSSGYVGIGTPTPGAMLEVAGASSVISNSSGDLTISTGGDNGDILLSPNGTGSVSVTTTLGIGTASPSAYLHIKAGTATASTAPLKFTTGTNLTIAEAGAMEWDGSRLYITNTTPTRNTIAYLTDIGTGHDALTLAAIGSTPNVNAATLTNQVLNLEPASASYGGVVTTLTQTFAGDKTFVGAVTARGLTVDSATATDDKIAISITTAGATSYTGTLTNIGDFTAARTWKLQDATGVIPLGTDGNTLFFTTTGATNVTLPTSGTLATTSDIPTTYWSKSGSDIYPTTSGDNVRPNGTATLGTSSYRWNFIYGVDADLTSSSTTTNVLNVVANSLTSGKALNISSSQATTPFFTGTLADITLSGSNAANTGSLLTLNNTGTLNTNTTFLINHYASGTGNFALRVNDVASDTSPFVIDGDGNVGVGLTNPSQNLTIANLATDVTTGQILLQSARAAIVNGNILGGIDFSSNDTSLTDPGIVTARIQAISGGTHTTTLLNTGIAFSTTLNTTLAEAMRIAPNTNIGVGIIAPTGRMHIVGSQPVEVATTPGTAAISALIVTGGTGGDTSITTTGVGGAGGAISLSGGTGGQAPSTTVAGTGGAGGALAINGGTGGAALAISGNNTGGAGGAFTWTAGTGGAANGSTSGNNTGGAGGSVALAAGTGGAATVGTGNLVGGTGGTLTLSGGIGGAGATSTGSGGPIVFRTATTTTITERMRIVASGDVGIHLTNPSQDLTIANIAGDVTTGQLLLQGARSAIVSGNILAGIDFSSNDSSLTDPGVVTASIQAIATATHSLTLLNTDLAFSTTTGTTFAERMRILANGNVGIGTASPDYALQVNGVIAPETTDQDLGTTSLRWDLFANSIDADSGLVFSGLVTGDASNTKVLALDASNNVELLDISGYDTNGSDDFVNPMTTAGDIIYGGTSGAPTRLAGSTTNGYVLKYNTSTNVPYWAEDYGGTGGDNWGTQVVEKDSTLVGTGVTGSLLGINLANANIWTAAQTFRGGALFDTATATDDKIQIIATTGGSNTFTGTLTNSDLTATRTWYLPNVDGTLGINPMTTAGDIIYGGTSGVPTRLAGSTTNGYVLKYNTSTNIPYWAEDIDTTGTDDQRWDEIGDPTANKTFSMTDKITAFEFNSVSTTNAFSISSTSLTTGSLLNLSSTTTLTSGSVLKVSNTATTGLTGNVADFSGSLTTGSGSIVGITANAINGTGSGLKVTTSTTGALTNGLVYVYGSAAHTGNLVNITSATASGIGLNVAGNSLTTGTLTSLSSTSTALTTGGLLSISATGAPAASWTGDLAKIEYTNADADVDGSALKVGLLGTTALGSGTAVNITTSQTGTGALALRVNDDGTYTDSTPVVVDMAGNVGIGTATPSSRLHVVGFDATDGDDFIAVFHEPGVTIEPSAIISTASDRAISVQGAGAAYFMGRDVTNDIEFIMGTSATGLSFAGSMTSHDMTLRTNNTDRLIVQATTGYVGIGTASPDFALQVNGVIAPETTDQDLGTTSLRWDLYANSINADSGLVFSGLVTGDASNTKVLALDASNNVELLDISGMSSLWTDGGTTTYLTATGDNVAIGGTSTTSKFMVNTTAYSTIELQYGGTSVVDIFSNVSSNIFIGLDSGSVISTGTGNVALGDNALSGNTTGLSNTAIGHYALDTNVQKQGSTAIGYQAMMYADNAASAVLTYNTAVGYQALTGNATASSNTGTSNTAIGHQAMTSNTSGESNTALGVNTLNANTVGDENVAIGYNALFSNVGMRRSVAIGYDAMRYVNNSVSESYTYNTAVGYQALMGGGTVEFNTGTENTAIGYLALSSTTYGYQNTALGSYALAANTTGDDNVAVGVDSLRENSDGSGNVALGYQTLRNSTIGSFNVAIGDQALVHNVAKGGSVAIGYQAMLNAHSTATAATTYNTAVGYQALFGNSDHTNNSGTGNTVLGYRAGYAMTSGSNNTLLGYGAGDNLTSGGSNIIIGQGVDAVSATGSSQLNIGNSIYGNLSNDYISIGDSTPTEAMFTVGATSQFRVDTSGDLTMIKSVAYTWPTSNASGVLTNNGSGTLTWSSTGLLPTGTEGQMLYNNAGTWTAFSGMYWDDVNSRLGVGTTSPSALLHIKNGDSYFEKDDTQTAPQQITIRGLTNTNNQLLIGFNTTSTYGSIQAITQGTAYRDLILNGGGGNVGIGDVSPASLLTVGSGDLFQVNSSGDMVKIKNVTYSWPSSNASGVLTNNGSGTLTWAAAVDTDKLVAIDSSATAGYLGALSTDGVLRASSPISYTDGGDFITLGITANSITGSHLTDDTLDYVDFEDEMDLDANLILNQSTYTWTQNFTGTTTTGYTYNANSLTTGTAVSLLSTSTAGGASGVSKVLNISRSGTNSNTAHTAYGVYSSVTNTNATSGTNVAGYFSASGATTGNYGLIVENGYVGIGTTTPTRGLELSGRTFGGDVVYESRSDTGTTTITTVALVYDLATDATVTAIGTFNITALPDTDGTFAFIRSRAVRYTTGSVITNVQINGNQISTVQRVVAGANFESYTAVYISSAWRIIGISTADTADIAEWYPTKSLDDSEANELPEAGDIVVISEQTTDLSSQSATPDNKISYLTKSYRGNQSNIVGVVSTAPYLTMGEDIAAQVPVRPIALNGRVPVNVSNINGVIKPGDSITSSQIEGYGMKSTGMGTVVGKALEGFDPANGVGKEITCPAGTPADIVCGSILVFINISISDPAAYLDTLEARISQLEEVKGVSDVLTLEYSITSKGWYRIAKLDGFDDYAKLKINNSSIGSSQNLILSIDTVGDRENINVISNFTTGGYDITKARVNTENEIKYLEIYLGEANGNSIKVDIDGDITNWVTTEISKIDTISTSNEYEFSGVLFGVSEIFAVGESDVKIGGNLLASTLEASIGDSTNRWQDIYAKGAIRLGSGVGAEGAIRFNVEKRVLEFSNDGKTWVQMADLASQLVLSPEYPGAILFADGSDNYGSMISDAEESTGSFRNYYEWVSDRDTPQDYDILVRVTLPSDFVSWKEDAIYLDFMTQNSASTDNNKVDMYLMGGNGIDAQVQNGISKLPASWERVSIKGIEINDCNAAGGVCTLRVSVTSSLSYFVRVGDITLNYNRAL